MRSASKRFLAVLLAVLMLIPAMNTMVFATSVEDTVTTDENASPVVLEASLSATEYNDFSWEGVDTPIESIVVSTVYVDSNQDYYECEYWSEELGEWCYYTRYDWLDNLEGTVTFKDGTDIDFSGGYFYYSGVHYFSCADDQSFENQWEVGGTYTGTVTLMNYTVNVEIVVTEDHSVDNISYLEYDDGIIINGTDGSGEVLSIPETINGKPVIAITSLRDGWFDEIIIPDSVITISESAIRDCWDLEKITIGAGVQTITNSMFEDAEYLSEIIVSENNANYTSVDGIVYDKAITTMVAIPRWKDTTHTVPATVTNIDLYTEGNYYFRIILQNSVSGYIVEDGIVYNEDKTTVYSCSADKTGSYVMPETVTTIKPMAFQNCNLESVTVSSKVTDISYYSFYGSANLKKVVLPDTLTTISEYAFYECENLTDISLPNSLTRLDDCAFYKTGVKTITIPGGLEYWGYSVFAFSALENLTISKGVKEIGDSAFEYTKVKSVSIPSSVHTVQSDAFAYTPLKSVILANGLKDIDSYAFCGTELTSITFPKSLIYIGYSAFKNSKLTSLYIPANITDIGRYAFDGCPIKTLTLADGIVKAHNSSFYNTDIESIKFPQSVLDIEYESFAECEYLANIDLPDNLQSLCGTAFDGTAWLNNKPNGVVYLEQALYGYKGEMPTGTKVTVKNGTELIADYALSYESNLKNITLPETLKYIGLEAFIGCDSLQSITIPNSVERIDRYAFYSCDSLTSAVIGNSVTTIGSSAFSDCTSLTSITIPNSVTEIDWYAFSGCSSLTSAVIGNSLKSIEECLFSQCESLKTVTLGNSVTSIAYAAFGGCASLTDINLPSSLTSIGEFAFKECDSLKSISIPSSVTDIGYAAFYDCDSLTNIYCEAKTEPSGWHYDWNYGCGATVHWGCNFAKITKQPTSVTVLSGNTAKVTVNATGDGLTYKWYFKDKGASKYTLANSVKGNSYSITMSSARAGRRVICIVTDKYGNKVQSNTVTLGMSNLKITKQPTSVTVLSGKTAKVTVNATGDGLTYKWYFKDKGATKYTLTNAYKGNSYSITMSSARAGRRVICIVTDKYGNKVQSNTVTLGLSNLKITKQPNSVIVSNGKTAKVTVNATGSGLKYQWYFKDSGSTKYYPTTSFKSNTYSITMNSVRAGRKVYCKITDKYGNSVITNAVTLHIKPTITKQPKTTAVQSGKTAKVTVSAVGTGLTYKWYYKNKGASKFTLTNSFKSSSYSIKMSSGVAGRQVYCVITDKYGNKVQTKTVTLGMAAKITTQPTSVKVANGKTAKVTVSASGEGKTYKWYFKDKGASKFSRATSFKGNTYSVKMTNARAGRQVYCVITDKYGNKVQTKTVTLNKK